MQIHVKPETDLTPMVDVAEITKPIASPIRNAYIDFSKMTVSLVAVVTDVVRDGRRGLCCAKSVKPGPPLSPDALTPLAL